MIGWIEDGRARRRPAEPPAAVDPPAPPATSGTTPAAARVARSLEPDVGPPASAVVPPSISITPGPARTPDQTPPAARPFPEPLEGTVRVETIKVGTHEVEAKEPARPFEPDQSGQPVPLARYVPDEDAESGDRAALVSIPPRCPGHERIELALDRRGRIHLLGHEDTLRAMPASIDLSSSPLRRKK